MALGRSLAIAVKCHLTNQLTEIKLLCLTNSALLPSCTDAMSAPFDLSEHVVLALVKGRPAVRAPKQPPGNVSGVMMREMEKNSLSANEIISTVVAATNCVKTYSVFTSLSLVIRNGNEVIRFSPAASTARSMLSPR